MNTKRHFDNAPVKYLPIVAMLCGAAFAVAGTAQADAPAPARKSTASFLLGAQKWPALHDLDTHPYGTFDKTGWNLAASAHVPVGRGARGEWLVGMDLGLIDHESSITAPGDIGELSADILFLTPSLRWAFRERRRVRVNLEAGAGMYLVAIREFIQLDYDFVEGTRHFEQWAPGGFIGISFDVPVGRTRRWSINTGARMHYVDFGNVGALGTDLGRLDGPITTLQLGMSYDWGGNQHD